MPKNLPVPGRWWQKVDVSGADACWPWTASRDPDGYGRFQYPTPDGQRHIRAHRWIYEHLNGPVADGLVVMHVCDNPSCVNPSHLTVGTPRDNNDDKVAKGRHAVPWGLPLRRLQQTHCKRGHEFTSENTRITARGHRRCKACEPIDSLAYYWRQKATPGRLEEVVGGRGDT